MSLSRTGGFPPPALRRLEGLEIHERMPLSGWTTIGTGGKARYFVMVNKTGALKKLLPVLEGPWLVLGGGSNVLISDRDFPGTVIRLGAGFRHLRRSGERLTCGAAVSITSLVQKAVSAGFPGFEELSGLPGTVGGAACMNAGTHLMEIGALVDRLWMVDLRGGQRGFGRGDLVLGYRQSLLPVDGVVTALSFLRRGAGNPRAQAARARELAGQRRARHPVDRRTFGSTFKNPPGQLAGRLIDQAGLKGVAVGGARVSPVHANFIENTGGAGALEILELIKLVRRRVREAFGVSLEPEVRLLGFTREELGELAGYAGLSR